MATAYAICGVRAETTTRWRTTRPRLNAEPGPRGQHTALRDRDAPDPPAVGRGVDLAVRTDAEVHHRGERQPAALARPRLRADRRGEDREVGRDDELPAGHDEVRGRYVGQVPRDVGEG